MGTTLTTIEASGQFDRCALEWRAYARAFGGAYWFGYGGETVDFDAQGVAVVVPGRFRLGAHAEALAMPFLRSWAFRRCRALRVLNLTGVVPALVARALLGTPFVLQVGYDAPAVARAHGKPVRARLLRHLQDLAVQRAAGVIYATRELFMWYAKWPWQRPPSVVIPNGVDLEHFRPLWRCPPGKSRRRVVYVGRLSREKNLDLLAAACHRIRATLHLFGAGPLAARLAALPGVTAYGPVPHYALPKILADFDAFCLPSETEGSPKALLEAMAVGVPCLASVGLLPTDGCVVVFDPQEDLADALAWVLADPAQAMRMSEAGRRWVEVRHDLRKTLQDEIAFVHNAVEGACAKEARQA